MPLHITKIAFRSESPASLRAWLESHEGEARITTRYLPKRVEEMTGGSLYWIHGHMLVGRSPILGFEETGQGRYWVRLEPRLIPVRGKPKRAHQGWRYLEDADAPPDLNDGEAEDLDAMPAALLGELSKLGLV
ncbi:DUF1489 family protein [Sphingobium sp. HWE2-09]|uniref:DUF1489 family protein n=1 Tax=Sphingobium sp. HWE2-09 TaxID=3108390 RepID=UPI002DD3DE94|nr:DUF1489 domain-containing protein [Sphingobium sp. HWE2-09]